VERVGHLGEQVLELLQLVRADPAGEFLVEVVQDARRRRLRPIRAR
jgi:hypothetical protein